MQTTSTWQRLKNAPDLPAGLSHKALWGAAKFLRSTQWLTFAIAPGYKFTLHYNPPPTLDEALHRFTQEFYGHVDFTQMPSEPDRRQVLVSSLMEEAIASSQIEGAVTTREAAKEMLRNNIAPKDASEHMILNNYETIRALQEWKDRPLDESLLFDIHVKITRNTLAPVEAGCFRTSSDIQLRDSNNDIVFKLPECELLPQLMEGVYAFVAAKEIDGRFLHPIARASILHFLIGFVHPFSDGNGRTARALFYWLLLKEGYWLMEYLSISNIIKKGTAAYYEAFQLTETDDNDLTYFVRYHLQVLTRAHKELLDFLMRKANERAAALDMLMQSKGKLNLRQTALLQDFLSKADQTITVTGYQQRFSISNLTARKDVDALHALGLLAKYDMGFRRRVGYSLAPNASKVLQKLLR